MSEGLQIYTLGGERILRDGKPVTGFGTRKAEALLIYLACTRRPHPREALADLLWDERSQRQALGNLRVALTGLRQQLGEFVRITREEVSLNPELPVWLDTLELEDCILSVQKKRRDPVRRQLQPVRRGHHPAVSGGISGGLYPSRLPAV